MSLIDLAPVSSSISNTIRRKRHLERRGVGQVALAALVDVEFRRLELVVDEFQHRGAGEVGDREHRLEDRLQALVGATALRLVDHQELVVGCLLNLDEVRHLRDFADLAEELAYAPATVERLGLGHRRSLLPFSQAARLRAALFRAADRRPASWLPCAARPKRAKTRFRKAARRPSGKRFPITHLSRSPAPADAAGLPGRRTTLTSARPWRRLLRAGP